MRCAAVVFEIMLSELQQALCKYSVNVFPHPGYVTMFPGLYYTYQNVDHHRRTNENAQS